MQQAARLLQQAARLRKLLGIIEPITSQKTDGNASVFCCAPFSPHIVSPEGILIGSILWNSGSCKQNG